MKLTLRAFLGFLTLTALIAIISVLGGDFGEFEWKIIITSLTLSLASICAMSCAAFMARNKQQMVGGAGIAAAVIGATLTIAGVWGEVSNDTYWKTTLTFGITALACAHGFLLILPDLGRAINRWFRPFALGSVAILALQIIMAAWGEISLDGYYRAMAAVAIVVGLVTASLPILIKLKKDDETRRKKLVLTKLNDGTYRDSDGRRYVLTAYDPEKQCP
jgi:hypothetical protein